MKVLKSLVLSTLFILAILIVGCVEHQPQPILTTSELLSGDDPSGRSYFISSAEISLFDLNGTLQLDECVTDNTIIYYPNGRYEENEGRTKCEIENPPGSTGTWEVTSRETEIIIIIDGVAEEWSIESVTDHVHKLTRTTLDGKITFVMERL